MYTFFCWFEISLKFNIILIVKYICYRKTSIRNQLEVRHRIFEPEQQQNVVLFKK